MGTMLLGDPPAQIQVLTENPREAVFSGAARPVSVLWRNTGDTAANLEVRTCLYQTTTATAVRVGEANWKKLLLLPHQTVLESAMISFPAVRTPTHFLIQWREGSATVLGETEVTAYPTDPLRALRPLLREGALGIYDPVGRLQVLLREAGINFTDLENSGWRDFIGRWAIIEPGVAPPEDCEAMVEKIRQLAARGVRVIWLQPPSDEEPAPPAICVVSAESGVIVRLPADLVSELALRPRSQLNLIYALQLASRPGSPFPDAP